MTTITQKIKTKTMADVGHHMFTKSVFYTPPLLKKNHKWISSINLFTNTATPPRGDYVQVSVVLQTGRQCSERVKVKIEQMDKNRWEWNKRW